MKKLMIAAAIAVSTMAANAASVMWTVGAAYDPVSGDELGDVTGFYAYFFVDSVTAGSTTTYSHATATSKVNAGDISFLSNAIGDGVEIEYGGGGTTADLFDNNNTVVAYILLLDAENAADATKAYLSDTLSTSINGMGSSTTLDWGNMTATQDIKKWKAVSAPEPTSGLLMLLGLSGLALRRKQA